MKHCLVFASLISPSKMILFEKKYQTFDTVFHHQMKHLEVRQKYSAARRIFDSLLGVSSGDETLHLMFDILHQVCGEICFFFRLSYFDYSDLQLFAIFIFEVDFSETYFMTRAEKSVSEPPNLKFSWGGYPQIPLRGSCLRHSR